jgi:hypothetical protein
MGKPYSVDLRKRVVAAIEGGMSRNQAYSNRHTGKRRDEGIQSEAASVGGLLYILPNRSALTICRTPDMQDLLHRRPSMAVGN